MNLQKIIWALLFVFAAALMYYVPNWLTPPPVKVSDAEYLCRHAIATGNVIYARNCI